MWTSSPAVIQWFCLLCLHYIAFYPMKYSNENVPLKCSSKYTIYWLIVFAQRASKNSMMENESFPSQFSTSHVCVCVCGCDCLSWGSTISCHYLFKGMFENTVMASNRKKITGFYPKRKSSSAGFGIHVSLDRMAASVNKALCPVSHLKW